MEIRRVRQDEFDELMDVMNKSFGFDSDEAKFQHILPKYYYPENREMVHIAACEGGKIVSSVGLYPEKFINGGNQIDVACVGGVSTLPEFRGKGYFTEVMDSAVNEARDMGMKLLFLGGDRLRYGRFGFEYGGRTFSARISRRTAGLLKPRPFEVRELTGGESPEETDRLAGDILRIYNTKKMRFLRQREKVIDVLRSWNCRIFYIVSEGETVGYFALHGNETAEIGFVCDIDTAFAAVISITEEAGVHFGAEMYCPEVLEKVGHYSVSENHMFNILDEEALVEFLGGKKETLAGLPADKKARIRLILGDALSGSVTGTDVFISGSDSG